MFPLRRSPWQVSLFTVACLIAVFGTALVVVTRALDPWKPGAVSLDSEFPPHRLGGRMSWGLEARACGNCSQRSGG